MTGAIAKQYATGYTINSPLTGKIYQASYLSEWEKAPFNDDKTSFYAQTNGDRKPKKYVLRRAWYSEVF